MLIPDTSAIFRMTAVGIILFTGAKWVGAGASSAQSVEKSERDTPPAGRWLGSDLNGQQVPFRLDVSGSGDQVRAALSNGREDSPASCIR
jgi:hypothetical protein